MNYEAEGAVPIYAWQVTVPDGTVYLQIGAQAYTLVLTGDLWGYDAIWDGSAEVIEPTPGTVAGALWDAIAVHMPSAAAGYVFDPAAKAWPRYFVEVGATASLIFPTLEFAEFFGFSTLVVPTQTVTLPNGATVPEAFVSERDSAGYWTPKRGLGSHAYRSDPRSRYALAEYGSGASAAQWGADWWELSAIHRDTKLGMLYRAARNDAAYAVPAGVDPLARHNLYEHLWVAAKRLQEIRLWRRQPFGSPLKLEARGQLAAPEYRETIQGQCQTVALRWHWLNYPTGA